MTWCAYVTDSRYNILFVHVVCNRLLWHCIFSAQDPVYAPWEESRLFLKGLYGAAPEDDIFRMEPRGREMMNLRLDGVLFIPVANSV